jgi:hypothetical protein
MNITVLKLLHDLDVIYASTYVEGDDVITVWSGRIFLGLRSEKEQ